MVYKIADLLLMTVYRAWFICRMNRHLFVIAALAVLSWIILGLAVHGAWIVVGWVISEMSGLF